MLVWCWRADILAKKGGFVPSDEPFLAKRASFFAGRGSFQAKKPASHRKTSPSEAGRREFKLQKAFSFVGIGTSEPREGVFETSLTVFKRRWGVRRGVEGCALGARPSPAASACQTALQAACPYAVHGMKPMQGGGLENPPSFSPKNGS